jgi:C-terminal processing protease CtpA/Prc
VPALIASRVDREALFNPALDRFTRSEDGQFNLRPQFAADVLQERKHAPQAFEGPVTVLIGPANASGATMVVAKLRDMGRVRPVGEPSGGSADRPAAGTIFNVKLSNSGISVRVPVIFNQMNVQSFERDGGVRPDVAVPQTVADFRAGNDRQLMAAIADLSHRA